MAFELVPYSSLEALLELEDGSIDDYPALDIIRDGVTFAFEEYTGRELEKIERTESIFIGNSPTQMISLPGIPIASISSVVVTCGGTEIICTNADYEITGYGIKLYSKIRDSKVVVIYIGGWLTVDVPGAVARAALLQVAYEFQSKEQIGATSTTNEGGTVNRPELGLLKEVKRMLNRFKHPLKVN